MVPSMLVKNVMMVILSTAMVALISVLLRNVVTVSSITKDLNNVMMETQLLMMVALIVRKTAVMVLFKEVKSATMETLSAVTAALILA